MSRRMTPEIGLEAMGPVQGQGRVGPFPSCAPLPEGEGIATSVHHHRSAHRLQAFRITSWQHLQSRRMSAWRGEHAPPPQAPYWKSGHIVLQKPSFLPIHVPDRKIWRPEENVTGIVHERCIDETSLFIKFDPVEYLKGHPLMEEVPVLGEAPGTCNWKFTEDGKYTTKSLLDLIGTFHDLGCCIPTLSIDSVAINSAGRFELVEAKSQFTALTPRFHIPNFRIDLKGKVKGYMPYRKTWIIMASNNRYMIEWLKYPDRLSRKQFKGKWYELLQFVRNVICHKMELLMKGEVYQAAEVENMLHAIFPRLLPHIQHFLWQKGCLRDFDMETYFMQRKVTEWKLNRQNLLCDTVRTWSLLEATKKSHLG
ncbi:hypothetical protein PVAP13_3NG295600 [Panicum virgatum]|uniref:Uncharacterized protein n=1 Tax=Panicum virgatum TaxID=38727 RepID=A0A8T0UD41_PANVG|nr:hypothetical protein PVAP13_3NG295600 [Panicum virgatum]